MNDESINGNADGLAEAMAEEEQQFDSEAILDRLSKHNIPNEFAKFAVDLYDEDALEKMKPMDIFKAATDTYDKAQKLFGKVARDMASNKQAQGTETLALKLAGHIIMVARLVRTYEPSRLSITVAPQVSVKTLKTGKDIVTYETVLEEFIDEAREALAPEHLQSRFICDVGLSVKAVQDACRDTLLAATKALAPKGDLEAARRLCFVAAMVTLTLLWDLRVFWAFGGLPGLQKRIKELKKEARRKAREAASKL